MSAPPPPSPVRAAPAARRRLFGHWWRSQSPARQDRFVTVGPLVSVLLFLAAIISAFWYLRNEEIERETDSLKRDTEIAQQQIQLRLIDSQEQLLRLARELATRTVDSRGFEGQARSFAAERPELTQLLWLAPKRQLQGQWLAPGVESYARGDAPDPSLPLEGRRSEPERAFSTARDLQAPVYSRSFSNGAGMPVFQVHVPLIDRNGFVGALVAEYSVQALERLLVPAEVTKRHAISVLDEAGNEIAGTGGAPGGHAGKRAAIVHDVPLSPGGTGLVLRGIGWRTSIGLISNTLFWMVVALSVLTVWMLLGAWRHMRRRTQIQNALIQETNFRRAMENSMLTGMRAMDLQGRITYVNPAFCAMTGFAESELIDRRPPYPHWPPDRLEENARLLRQELQGRSPAGGVEVKVMRKDGQMFDARMYVSPLIDPKGQQTGWMTSMTNITEAKRIRDQLSASHERFTTVLEGLDAAVSVLSVEQSELLFANRSYRLWFSADARGHALLAGSPPQPGPVEDSVDTFGGLPVQELTQAGSDPREVFIESLQKWFDVRSRYLQWTDGRLAQMLIATDITARHQAEEQQRLQAEKAQVTSRLVTMGEMASSVAHELNQPLTAIANYCSGMVSRVQADTITKDDLIAALKKTARQAERAGQIIHRIRAFVKKSEPQRQPSQANAIVEDAVDLAGIELRRRHVQIHTYVAQRLPTLMVDPILIEQVVLNLVKNAAEAIDMAKLPQARRHIELRVVPRHTPDEGGVIEFSVTDKGPGMKEEVLARMFEAFFSTKAEGLGIGLSLCRSIIESHRGRMRAENIYNGTAVVGCRFSFTLPVEPGARIEPAAPATDPNSTTETTSP
ncbi:PAS domain S-box protein [Azohydromonas australica]|uniref:PAS domain S-box protein n=1 Tax=Azohydromonas australica TaxID=364039 RepID=UPI00048D4AAF|nr:PAS domain S-box protein [Azohydromonas australica]